MNVTSIEWCNRPGTTPMTWNPIRALHSITKRTGTFCTRISPGCTHCYASTLNERFGTKVPFEVPHLADHTFFLDPRILEQPLKRKKPATIFVGDMFDLFHEAIPDDMIHAVLEVSAEASQHVIQFLTKRAERMKEIVDGCLLPNPSLPEHMWWGVSVEDAKRAKERIPFLRAIPAALRFLSIEPQLEHVDISDDLKGEEITGTPFSGARTVGGCAGWIPPIDWVICGGESGRAARGFNLAWAKSLLDQCHANDVPFFMKQIGSRPYWMSNDRLSRMVTGAETDLILASVKDAKGGDMNEWPASLRVREFPR